MPVLLLKDNNNFDTAFQIRPFLIVDDGRGVLVIENSDYLALKITTKKNRLKKVEEIKNWKELGLREKSYVRLEIPERIENYQLIEKITELPKEQFIEYYKKMIDVFNVDAMRKIVEKETVK